MYRSHIGVHEQESSRWKRDRGRGRPGSAGCSRSVQLLRPCHDVPPRAPLDLSTCRQTSTTIVTTSRCFEYETVSGFVRLNLFSALDLGFRFDIEVSLGL